MKKLTAGILTVMLGIVSANSADAAVASKLYVDSKAKANADAIAQEVTDRGTAITNLSNTLTTEIGKKVAQSDYNTKVQELENADTNISNLVGTIPESATASTIVGYIQEKTSGIATEGAMNELSGRVTQAETDIDNLESKVGNQTVAEQIAGYVTGLNLANTYDAKGSAADAETAAKAYADGLINAEVVRADAAYATAAQGAKADTAVQSVVAGATNGTISVDGTDIAVTGLGSAAYTSADAYDAKGSASAVMQAFEEFQSGPVSMINTKLRTLEGDASTAGSVAYAVNEGKAQAIAEAKSDASSQISKLNLNELSRVPAECGVTGKYCVLTSDGTNYLWEVIERAADEVQETGTPIPSVIQNPADK